MQFHDRKAIYLQIADLFYDQILRGKLGPNDRIPSVSDLAAELEVTPNTVQRAYAHLHDKGVFYTRRGIGYFVSPQAKEIAREIKLQEFVEKELPIFFSQMEALGLDFEQLKKYYTNFKSQQDEKQNQNK